MVYKWSIGLYSKVDANVAGKEIERIEKENGEVTNQAVVDAARPKESVLHGLFEWNDKIAGEKWRLQQARCMLAALVVDQSDDGYDKRAFVNVTPAPENPSNPPRFINYKDAMRDEDMRETLLKNAIHELEILKDKYETLTELQEVFTAIESVKRKRR